jgi:hypothetical protein
MDAAALLEKAHDVVAIAALLVARSIARTRTRRAVALAKVR